MPELPEVETTRRGVAPWCLGEVVEAFRTLYGNTEFCVRVEPVLAQLKR